MRGGSHVILVLAVAVAGMGIVALAGPEQEVEAGDPAELVAASGALQIQNSRRGRAILRGLNMAPGQAVGGRVKIRNRSARPAVLWLRVVARSTGGSSAFARHLHLRVTRVGANRCAHTLHTGNLDRTREVRFGRMGAAETRSYGFSVLLGDGAGNEIQGRAASVRFRWLLREDEERRPRYPCFGARSPGTGGVATG
jgi:hypothetical protein